MQVNSKQLRARLSYYLDKLESGQEITIIRRSYVIGKLIPAGYQKQDNPEKSIDPAPKGVVFRQYRLADLEPVKHLHEQALRAADTYIETEEAKSRERDLDNIEGYYLNTGGEFLVGELDGTIVAMGGFRMSEKPDQAELKRMRVHPDLQGRGIGSQLISLLEDKARQLNYQTLVLDTTTKLTTARKFYESHGYQETHRGKDGPFTFIFYRKEL